MSRIALGVEYDGTEFVGWQTQRHGRSVQSTLGTAVEQVAAESVSVHAAGRTDAGVHATQQVVHFDSAARRTPRQWQLGINTHLPPDVVVRWVHEVPCDFDARRSALHRRYRYLILQQGHRPALARRRAWWLRETLSPSAMTAAAAYWLGEHDFSAFRAAGCQSHTPMRRLMRVTVARHSYGDGSLLAVEFTANAFLQHMVRNLVGVLTEIGRGAAHPRAAYDVLASRTRTAAGVTAPAHGLTLVDVGYPQRFGLPPAPSAGPAGMSGRGPKGAHEPAGDDLEPL
jgi:tRNA pseudouridine38-40 synthase